ncbi:MAG: TIGR03842 family LLM class F420-dependent oxidoreductase [Gaiellaceae bacterium]
MDFGVTVLPDPPSSRMLELLEYAEKRGFGYGWTYDSHILWQECMPLLTMMAMRTSTMKVGLCVTNPGTRDPTVLASAHATLQDVSDGRVVMGIGRGDSARRTIGLKPVRMAEYEAACVMMKELMNGRVASWNEQDLQLEWAKDLDEIPLFLAGYGPKALAVAGRVSDGVIIQLADPDIVEWIMSIARKGAEEAGRDPDVLRPIICAPAYVSDDMAEAREQVRWFPAMVSNHVMDLLKRYDESELPPALFEYVKRREFYDYKDHSRVGAAHGEFVDDETCDRFCILGTPEQHIEKLKQLEAVGVDQWNIYLMTHGQERTLDIYGEQVIPAFR